MTATKPFLSDQGDWGTTTWVVMADYWGVGVVYRPRRNLIVPVLPLTAPAVCCYTCCIKPHRYGPNRRALERTLRYTEDAWEHALIAAGEPTQGNHLVTDTTLYSGGQFIVNRELVLARPKAMYMSLLGSANTSIVRAVYCACCVLCVLCTVRAVYCAKTSIVRAS